jgi:hypothetical protein
MARKGSSNAAIMESEALTPEESKLMDDNRQAEFSIPEPEPAAPVTKTAPEPTPEPETIETTEPDDVPVAETPPEKRRMVDYGALHEERERRKAADKEKAELARQLATITGRFSTLEELAKAAAAQTQPKPQIPDVNSDPVAHFQAELRARDEKIAQFENWQRQQQQQAEQAQQINQIRAIASQQEAEFAKETPDYQEAATYVQQARLNQLRVLRVPNPEQAVAQEALQLAVNALQQGVNPAQMVYEYAKTVGWAPKVAAPTPSQPAPAAPKPAAPAAGAKKLETVAKGQAANASLSQLNGSASPETTIESVLKMSDEEFAKWATPENWRAMAGT